MARRIFFDNGYGASIIEDPTYDGFEMAVLEGTEDSFELTFDTPVTDDVIRGIPTDSVGEVLDQIKALPSR